MPPETLRRGAYCPHCHQELVLRASGGGRRATTYFHCQEHGTIPYPVIRERT